MRSIQPYELNGVTAHQNGLNQSMQGVGHTIHLGRPGLGNHTQTQGGWLSTELFDRDLRAAIRAHEIGINKPVHVSMLSRLCNKAMTPTDIALPHRGH